MPKLKTSEDLKRVREEARKTMQFYRAHVMVCRGTGCTAGGSESILEALQEEVRRHHLEGEVRVGFTGCHGFCEVGPNVVIYPDDLLYTHVAVDDVEEIVEETLIKGQPVERLLYKDPRTAEAIPHYHETVSYTHLTLPTTPYV